MSNKANVRKLSRSEVNFIVKGANRGDLHIIAPWCIWPIRVQKVANRNNALPDVVKNGKGRLQVRHTAELNLGVACRRCVGCLEHKKRLWGARAYHETLHAFRTWFGTLTFDPTIHEWAIAQSIMRCSDDGLVYSTLTESEQHAVEAEVLFPIVQKYFKRLRKSGYRFRYLCVAEPHASGLIHFHLLLHEITPHETPKRVLEGQWTSGLSHFRLVQTGDKRAVWYVCKYLSKEPDMKPRASLHYGTALKLSRRDVGANNRDAPIDPKSIGSIEPPTIEEGRNADRNNPPES